MDDVTLRIGGAAGHIEARSLQHALRSLLDLLEAAEEVTSRGERHPWVLSTLEEGSAVAGLAHPSPGASLKLVDTGLTALHRVGSVPEGWTSDMVKSIRSLGRLVGRAGTERVQVGLAMPDRQWDIDGVLTSHANTAVQASQTTFGTLSGVVDRFSERRERVVGITLDVGHTVTARFPAELRERIVSEAVGRRGDFWGDLDRNDSGQPISLRTIDFSIEGQSDLPTPPSAVRGLLKQDGWTLDTWLEARGV